MVREICFCYKFVSLTLCSVDISPMNVYGYLIIYVTLLYGEIDIPREQQRTPIADPSLYDNA